MIQGTKNSELMWDRFFADLGLTVLNAPDLLFVQFSILSKADRQNYPDVLLSGRGLLEKALATMGLEFHDQL